MGAGRIVIMGLLLAIGLWLAVDALITTDAERVEAEVERLLDLARQGGEDAAAEILDAVADDYRGAYSKETIGRYLRMCLVDDRVEELTTGSPAYIPKGGEVLIPLFRLDVRTKRFQGTAILRVTFAKRDGRFRIVSVENWRSER
ncbi:MAG: hypothetical protein L6Q95_13890 [Planctomycetes bacterium]|nr:hypothetical protein [Planctomycetota bacterium]